MAENSTTDIPRCEGCEAKHPWLLNVNNLAFVVYWTCECGRDNRTEVQ